MEESKDKNLDIYIEKLYKKYGNGIISEKEACEILMYTKVHFHRLRKNNSSIIPFFKIGLRISYLIDDVIEYIKKNRIK